MNLILVPHKVADLELAGGYQPPGGRRLWFRHAPAESQTTVIARH